MGLDRQLSELEATALGIVLKSGPCLAHAVVSQFAGSYTFAHRSGAGSIYPLLKRMASAGLLDYANRRYTLTDSGRAALKTWIRPPLEVGTNLDSLRSRAYFLKVLQPEEVDEFTREALAGLRQLLSGCNETVELQRQSGDRFGELAMLGAVYETEARIAWIERMRRELGVG